MLIKDSVPGDPKKEPRKQHVLWRSCERVRSRTATQQMLGQGFEKHMLVRYKNANSSTVVEARSSKGSLGSNFLHPYTQMFPYEKGLIQ